MREAKQRGYTEPDPRDDLDFDLTPVNVLVEVEDIGLQTGRAVVDGRPHAETGHAL